jgi:hypothetical protein
MSDLADVAPVCEKKEADNFFNKYLYKAMQVLGFTSGVGLVGIGGFWFIYSVLQYIFAEPESAMQQIITENYFNQAQTGIVIVALGILIMEVKKFQSK